MFCLTLYQVVFQLIPIFMVVYNLPITVMYKNSCGFICENFPKENQMLQTRNDLCLSTKPQLFLYGVIHVILFRIYFF